MSHRVRLHRENGGQVVHIPRGLELPGDEVVIDVEEGHLTVRPLSRQELESPNLALISMLRTMEPIDIDLPDIDDPPPEPFDLEGVDPPR